MKTILKTVACISVLPLAFSCALTDIDTQMTDEQAIAAIRLECTADPSYTLSEKEQVITFHVTSTTPWTISGQEDVAGWLSLSPASSSVSSLSEDVRVTIQPNKELLSRTATLKVSGRNTDIAHTIVITQLPEGMLEVTPAESEISASGDPVSFTILTNLAWSVTAADDWLSFSEASGTGDATVKTIQARAVSNSSIARSTTVTVTAGEFTSEFVVKQKGLIDLDFILDEDPIVDRTGKEPLVIGVKADSWVFEIDNPLFTAEKVGDDKIQVLAPWNNQFAPRKATLTIRPSEGSDISRSLELTQDVNFKLGDNCELLPDGSVKISSGKGAHVTTVDEFRFVSIVMTLGDKHFGENAQFWCTVNTGGCNIYNQLTLNASHDIRIRTDGTLPVSGESSYKNAAYKISQEELNAMTEYRFDVLPDPANPLYHLLNFYYNGTQRATLNFLSVFRDSPESAGAYWFGYSGESAEYVADDTWYIVKTCDITPIAEE